MIALSIVTPVFEEAAVVRELVLRIDAAAARTGLTYEIVVVDDASQDGTPVQLRVLAAEASLGQRLQVVRAPQNLGQFRATQLGLRHARGRQVVVLDGDLQDPPEVLGQLVDAARQSPKTDAIFAVKVARKDPAWFLLGRAMFAGIQRLLSGPVPPRGAGSYVLMTAELAAQVALVDLADANLAPVLAVLGARTATLPYVKAGRYDGTSRVGALGLVREAMGSLALTGALARLLVVLAAAFLGAGGTAVLVAEGLLEVSLGVSALTVGSLTAVGAHEARQRQKAALRPVTDRLAAIKPEDLRRRAL